MSEDECVVVEDHELMRQLIGKTLTKIVKNTEQLELHCAEGIYIFKHEQDCCECVEIADIVGDLNDLIGSPILKSELSTSEGNNDWDSFTWSFYKFATIKGYVDIKWYGWSNGYYSERVSIIFKSNSSDKFEVASDTLWIEDIELIEKGEVFEG